MPETKININFNDFINEWSSQIGFFSKEISIEERRKKYLEALEELRK